MKPLVERFLMDGYKPQQLSTFALTLYNHKAQLDGKTISVDFWDTAGQEKFNSMHPSYYHQAHACILTSISFVRTIEINLEEKQLRCPNSSRRTTKINYAASKDGVVAAFSGWAFNFEGENIHDLKYEMVKERIVRDI